MEDLEFKTLLRHLGQDVGYMGLKLKKDVLKCVNELDSTHDSRRYCEKLVEIFTKFAAYTVEHAKSLEERIKAAGKAQEYENIIKSLHQLTWKEDNSCNDTGQNGECSVIKPSTSGDNPLNDISKEVDLELSQCSSLHIGKEFKEENLTQVSLDENVPVNYQSEDQGSDLQSEPSSQLSTNASSNMVINDIPNEKECNNFLEVPPSEEVVSEERTAELNETFGSQSTDNTFDKETVVNSPPGLDAVDDQISDSINEHLTLPCEGYNQEHSPNLDDTIPSKFNKKDMPCDQDDNISLEQEEPLNISDTTTDIQENNTAQISSQGECFENDSNETSGDKSEDSGITFNTCSSSPLKKNYQKESVNLSRLEVVSNDPTHLEHVDNNQSTEAETPKNLPEIETTLPNENLAASTGSKVVEATENLITTDQENEANVSSLLNGIMTKISAAKTDIPSNKAEASNILEGNPQPGIVETSKNLGLGAKSSLLSENVPPEVVEISGIVSTMIQKDEALLNKNITASSLPGLIGTSEHVVEASNSDSDTTVANLTPPRNSGSESDDTVVYGNVPGEVLSGEDTIGAASELSQIFSVPCHSDQSTIEHSDKGSDGFTHADDKICTVNMLEKVVEDYNGPTQVNVVNEAVELSKKNKKLYDDTLTNSLIKDIQDSPPSEDGNQTKLTAKAPDATSHWDSDVDYDMATQVLSSRSPVTTNAIENDDSSSPRDNDNVTDSTGLKEVEAGKTTSDIEQHEESNNVVFIENTPKDSVVAEGTPKPMPRETDDNLKSANAVGGGDSDVFGDVSESESSPEDMEQIKSKKKLKDEDRKSLLKLISEYYRKRRKEKILLEKDNNRNSRDVPHDEKTRRKSPRKKEDNFEQDQPSSSSKKNLKRRGTPMKYRKDKAKKRLHLTSDTVVIDQSSSSSDEFSKDNMDIHEESSDSNNKGQKNAKKHLEANKDTVIDSTDSQEFIESNNETAGKESSNMAPNANDCKPNDALEEDLEATQPYFIKPAQKVTEDNCLTDDKSLTESQIVNPYKRKSVIPLPHSQSEESSSEPNAKSLLSQDSDRSVVSEVLPPPSSHQSDIGSGCSDQEASQVVCPFKRKKLKPIPSSETSDFDDSQVIRFKRKGFRPLPSSQSDEGTRSNEDEWKENERKRPHSPMESDSDGTDNGSTMRVNGTDDSGSDVLIISSSSKSPDDHHVNKRPKVNSESKEEDLQQANENRETVNEDSSPLPTSQFKLDDDGRDDLLEMLDQLSKETRRASSEDDGEKQDNVAEIVPEPVSQFKLCDSDRDNLLNLLTDKENDGSAETSDDRVDEGLKTDEVGLNSAGRNELLDLLNDVGNDRVKDSDTTETSEDDEIETIRDSDDKPDDENSDNRDDENSDRFKLGEDERNELLNLLSEHLKDSHSDSSDVDGSGPSSDSGNDDASAGQKREASTDNSKRKKIVKEIDRDVLLDLLKEYEEAVTKGTDINASYKELVAIKNDGKMGRIVLDMDTGLDLPRLSDISSDEDSRTDSILLDVLKEEAVEENDDKQGGSSKSKDESEEAWNAYQALLDDDEDGDISETSSEISDIDLEDLEQGFLNQERKRLLEARNSELRKQFGIFKELIIDVEAADISGFDISDIQAPTSCNESNEIDSNVSSDLDDELELDFRRLCDLSDVLGKKTTSSMLPTNLKRSRLTTSSSDSSQYSSSCHKPDSDWSQSSDSEADDTSLLENQISFGNPNSPPHCAGSDHDERERFANELFANIKNSSDENSGLSSNEGNDSEDSEEDEKKAKKRKAISLESSEVKSKKMSSEGSEDSDSDEGSDGTESGSEIDNNADSGDQEKKEKVSKEVDLDSSDEEDFVGVRKGRGAWRHDPLLHECLTSDSDEDTDSSERPKKQERKRKENKSGRKVEGDSDSDATSIKSDDMKTPVKKSLLSDESDDSDFEIIEKEKTPQKPILITDDEDTPSKWGKGRRNIRALVQDDDLAVATQRAHNEEKERIRRLQERDKAKESLTQSQSFCSQLSEDEPDPLILDMTEDIQIKVHPKITQKLKPHQRDGIQFMWDSCYESIQQLKKGWQGSGCILAHCMGLGKTLQALALIQTLFAYPVTKTKHVLVVCPLSTVSNWRNEYNLAFKSLKNSHVKLFTIENKKAARLRFDIVTKWWKTGGMLVMGYECFGLLIDEQKLNKFEGRTVCHKESILKAMIDPGPDLIICDEGHLLRNKQSQRTLALNRVKTRRRIILTGTPLQNNLLEYYYMVHFVKPNLLGTEKEYKTNFVNPISNGQFEDSTAEDIMFMKKRTHVLHKLLNRTVQRVEDTELKQYLPKLIDQAVFIKLSDLQVNLYNTYLDSANSRPVVYTKTGNISHKNFLADVQILRYICIHPNVVTTAENSKANVKEQDVVDDNLDEVVEEKVFSKGGWYKGLLTSEGSKKLELGSKMVVVVDIVKEAAACGDKVLIFAQSYAEMANLEYFLTEHLKYKKSHDYYRMDGTISPEVRTHMCDKFNKKSNTKVKVFIMSTKVGGLGLNLTAANRVIIMNVNWNPSYDTQSVFRSFRFGQKKAVYVYRLIAKDTMEEKMYQRVVTKLAIAHRVVDKHQITRHYSAADIQEFYSVRPTIGNDRPVPNVPEDRVLATLIQKRQFVYRWHEHQALLANRPEEDLDEHQKNAAWEEFNKKEPSPPIPGIQQTPLPNYVTASSILGQAGPSGLQNISNLPMGSQFKANGSVNLQQHLANAQNKVNVPSNTRYNSNSMAVATRRSERLNQLSSSPAVSLSARRSVFADNSRQFANSAASSSAYSLTLKQTPSGPKLVFTPNGFQSTQGIEIPLKTNSRNTITTTAVSPGSSSSLRMPLPLKLASYVVPPVTDTTTNAVLHPRLSSSLRMMRGHTNTIKIINDLMQARTTSEQIAELRPASEHNSSPEDQSQANSIDEVNSLISESLSQDGSWANDGMNDTLASLSFPDLS